MPGKGKNRWFKIISINNLMDITDPTIRRLARRGGVKRISKGVYDETRGVLKEFLQRTIRDAIIYTEYVKRKTVTVNDILFSLKKQGQILYGFETK